MICLNNHVLDLIYGMKTHCTRLYRLTRDELRYMLDSKEGHGEDFPGKTFRVLKEKEIKQFGEYQTRRLVLEARRGTSWKDEL